MSKLIAAIASCAIMASNVCAQYNAVDNTYTEVRKLTNGKGKAGDSFGKAVASYDDRVLVGAPQATSGSTDRSGAAYMYAIITDYPGFKLVDELASSTPRAYSEFGCSVAMSANWVIVGASSDSSSSNSGSATIFKRVGDYFTTGSENWVVSDQFFGKAADEGFGTSVAISDTGMALVGAPNGNNFEFVIGAGYVAVYSNSGGSWIQSVILYADDGSMYDRFGISVAVDQSSVLIGAYNADEKGFDTGRVYSYGIVGGLVQKGDKFKVDGDSDVMDYDMFGQAVALSSTIAAVGCPGDDAVVPNPYGGVAQIIGQSNINIGSVHVWVKQSNFNNPYKYKWIWVQEITPGNSENMFGSSISLGENVMLIGSRKGGSAYYYSRADGMSLDPITQDLMPNKFSLKRTLTASDGTVQDGFGYAVAMSANSIVVGAPSANGGSTGSGAVYVYRNDKVSQQSIVSISSAGFFKNTLAAVGVMTMIGVAAIAAFIAYKHHEQKVRK